MRTGLFGKRAIEEPLVVESIRPVEIPILTTVKQCLIRGSYEEAVRYGYQAALYDLQRGYQTVFPPKWTNKDILAKGLPEKKGYLRPLFAQLYELYEPIRYGAPPDHQKKGDVVGILQSIYADETLWRLYAKRAWGPEMNHSPELNPED